jgi:hypothetical protein
MHEGKEKCLQNFDGEIYLLRIRCEDGLDLGGQGLRKVAGFCEHGDESSD